MYKLDSNLHPVNVHVFIDGCLSHFWVQFSH